jgi:hypothetical protein
VEAGLTQPGGNTVEVPKPQALFARTLLEEARRMFADNVEGISMDEALHAAGGYRSILGIVKHIAGWSAVYYSYAFDPEPRHWAQTDWPRSLRDEIAPTREYLDELLQWFETVYTRWQESVGLAELDAMRPLHWGEMVPLREIVIRVAAHWLYHTGEINEILAIQREEAWEYTEEVEENHIRTAGHGVRPLWMTDEQAAEFEREQASTLRSDSGSD